MVIEMISYNSFKYEISKRNLAISLNLYECIVFIFCLSLGSMDNIRALCYFIRVLLVYIKSKRAWKT